MKRRILVTWGLGFAIGLAMGTTRLGAQQVIDLRPGDPRLDGTSLQPHEAVFNVYDIEANGDTTRAGYWRSHLQEAHAGDLRFWRHTWTLYFAQTTVYDQTHFQQHGFAPAMRVILSPRGHDLIDFTRSDSIVFTNVPLGGTPLERSALPRDGDRFAGGGDFALIGQTLRLGDTYRFHSIVTDPPEPGEPLIRVTRVSGVDTIRVESGRRFPAWRLETHWTTEDGEPHPTLSSSTTWLADEPPYIVRRQYGNRVWELATVSVTARPPR